MSPTQKVPVFVISLARLADRRRRIAAHLDGLGVEYEIIDGVDGSQMSEEEYRGYLAEGKSYSRGVVGCYLSHLEAYKRIVEGGFEAGLILEDDAILQKNFVEVLRDGVDASLFDYCFLDCDDSNGRHHVFYAPASKAPLSRRLNSYRLSHAPTGTSALLVARKAAQIRLETALPIQRPIDVYTPLPYEPVFRAILFPKGGAMAPEARLSTIENLHDDRQQSLSFLRKSELYYLIRDALKLHGPRRARQIKRLTAQGLLDPDVRWKPLPSGRIVLHV